jgi:hypothetical protein
MQPAALSTRIGKPSNPSALAVGRNSTEISTGPPSVSTVLVR